MWVYGFTLGYVNFNPLSSVVVVFSYFFPLNEGTVLLIGFLSFPARHKLVSGGSSMESISYSCDLSFLSSFSRFILSLVLLISWYSCSTWYLLDYSYHGYVPNIPSRKSRKTFLEKFPSISAIELKIRNNHFAKNIF